MPSKRRGGSKQVKVKYGGLSVQKGSAKKEIRKLNQRIDRLEQEREAYRRHYGGLSFEARDIIENAGLHVNEDFDDDDIDFPMLHNMDGMAIFPPGEEALLQSHEGREYEEVLASLLENRNRRPDDRDRSDRVQKQVDSWQEQMPELVDAYLAFLAHGPPPNIDGNPVWPISVISFEENREYEVFHHAGSTTAVVSLARHGLIGGSPEKPTMAFPLHFLHCYRQVHRVCPRYGIESLARSVQHIHFLPRGTTLDEQLRTAYDAYLGILRHVKRFSLEALGRNTETAWTTTTCAPCMYKLQDEPALVPSMLVAMDGNNSLKMVDTDYRPGNPRTDNRTLQDYRWLEDSKVDEYKDEVAKSRARAKSKHSNSTNTAIPGPESSSTSATLNEDDTAWLEVLEEDDLAACIDTCVDRWRNAGPEAKKKMCQMFAIAGVFLAVCRHGHLLVICDMVRSGELMKYPLAVVDDLLKKYGEDLGLGYDIMCSFYKTLQRSEKLGPKIIQKRLIGVVPAFHGHAHNRPCQCTWHPQYISGVGNEDFEGCERTFSLSNHLAATTRLATPFHRRQAILEYFDFNDEDKHALSGNFIYQNYRDALERLEQDEPIFEDTCRKYGLSKAACEAFLIKEREYFASLTQEPLEFVEILEYAEALEEWWKAQKASDEAHQKFQNLPKTRHKLTEKQVRQIEARNRTTFERVKRIDEELCTMEDEIGIPIRWSPLCDEYAQACKQLVERSYQQALEILERLVVQRLFELTKLNMSGLGYKQREKISKALKSRAEAIRKALDRYNDIATRIIPPRPTLTFHQIIEMVTVADFDLLKDTRNNVAELIWAKEEHREAMRLHFRIRRSREEIYRLNIEAKRLITFLLDDYADYYHAVERTQTENPNLSAELSRQSTYRLAIHERIVKRLVQMSSLKGFTGSLIPGERLSRDPSITDTVPLPPWVDIVGLIRDGESFSAAAPPWLSDTEVATLDDEHADSEGGSEEALITFVQGLHVGDSESFQHDEAGARQHTVVYQSSGRSDSASL